MFFVCHLSLYGLEQAFVNGIGVRIIEDRRFVTKARNIQLDS